MPPRRYDQRSGERGVRREEHGSADIGIAKNQADQVA
jgi:hypothetical protein